MELLVKFSAVAVAQFLLISSVASGTTSRNSGLVTAGNAQSASYLGTVSDGVEQFQSIYFAESTAGKNRFAPPQPFVPPAGSAINATAPGPACPQALGSQGTPFLADITNISEDCLSLRIARPQGTCEDDSLPVMVFLYGGASTTGTIYDDFLDPTGLVQRSVENGTPVIYAAVNYRVSIFGYAASEALREAKSMNIGLRDQRAGLQWIHDNIEKFGGDPNRITSFGQSAGGTDTAFQIVAFGGKEEIPFQRAIMESGTTGSNPNMNTDANQNHTAEVAAQLNCTANGSDSQDTIECMRALPLDIVLQTTVAYATKLHPPLGFQVWQPTIDGDFIPDLPSTLLATGQFSHGIEAIAGWNTDDASIFVGAAATITNDSDVTMGLSGFFTQLTAASAATLLELYPESDFVDEVQPDDVATAQFYRASRIFRDVGLTCPALYFTSAMHRFGSPNVRLYELNQTVLGPLWAEAQISDADVSHYSEIPYIFNEDVAGGDNSPAQRALGGQVSGSCAAFASVGDPEFRVHGAADLLKGPWPPAFNGPPSGSSLPTNGTPGDFAVYVIGGPTPGVRLGGLGVDIASTESNWLSWLPVFGDGSNISGHEIAQEKLYERCAFINGLVGELGV